MLVTFIQTRIVRTSIGHCIHTKLGIFAVIADYKIRG